jgi:hypothetical protein
MQRLKPNEQPTSRWIASCSRRIHFSRVKHRKRQPGAPDDGRDITGCGQACRRGRRQHSRAPCLRTRERPLLAVDSTGRCNTLAKSFSRRLVVFAIVDELSISSIEEKGPGMTGSIVIRMRYPYTMPQAYFRDTLRW